MKKLAMAWEMKGREAAEKRAAQEKLEEAGTLEKKETPENKQAITCPYCGQAMELGKIHFHNTPRPCWQPADSAAVPFSFMKPTGGVSLSRTGGLAADVPAWYCQGCKKIVLDTE